MKSKQSSQHNGVDDAAITPSTAVSEDGELSQPRGGKSGGLAAGSIISDRYRVVEILGAGGTGTVYEVYDAVLDDIVALKLLHPELSRVRQHRQRIRDEVRLARRVSHPNVCRVHDLGQHEGELFVTMECVRGPTLRSLVRRTGDQGLLDAPLAFKVDLIIQICSGLSAAHRAGILHRDVKPDNVILDNKRAVLTDFGIASLTSCVERTGRLAGTPGYVAPEVFLDVEIDQRVDVYSCGVLTYELLAGYRPFDTSTLSSSGAAHSEGVPPLPPHAASNRIRSSLDAILTAALHPTPGERVPTIDQFAEAIGRAARGEVSGSITGLPRGSLATTTGTPRTSWTVSLTPAVLTPDPAQSPVLPRQTAGPQSVVLTPTRRAHIRVVTALQFRLQPGGAKRPARFTPAALPDSSEAVLTPVQSRFAEEMEKVIVDLGGTPLMVTDAKLTAVFGAPVALGDDAARAARAALTLVELSQATGSAAIDTARVVYRIGFGGSPSASGAALVNASKLLASAEPGQVRGSAATARHLVGRFRMTDVVGLDDPTQRVVLINPATDPVGDMGHKLPPLRGRDREVALLSDLVSNVCENRRPAWATVIAPGGYGKSRLRRELTDRFQDIREIDWLLARATPLGKASPFSLLASADPNWLKNAGIKGAKDRSSAFAAARRWLETRAARCPVVLLVEDAHWADEASLELLADVRRTLDSIPVGIIMFARPSLEQRLPGWRERIQNEPNHLLIDLFPLDDAAAREVARGVARFSDERELDELVARAAGNPFFVEELARNHREHVPSTKEALAELPSTVEAVIQARLDRLPPFVREAALAAAVVGRQFWRSAARAALVEPDAVDDRVLDEALAHLEEREIVFALPPAGLDDDRYAFKHDLVRDVAYKEMAPRDRRRAHSSVAQWLERRAKTANTQDHALAFAVAQHHDSAGNIERARIAYHQAGRTALKLFAYREAAQALLRAETLSHDADPSLLEDLGDALEVNESADAAAEQYLRALELTHDKPLVQGRLYRKLGHCALRRGDNEDAVSWYEWGLALVAPDGKLTPESQRNPVVAAGLFGGLGWVLGYLMGDNEKGLQYSQRAVDLLENTPFQRELAQALSRLGANYMRAGRWADQLRCNQRNLEIGEQLNDLDLCCTAHINLGVVQTGLGEIEAAVLHTRQGLSLAARTGAVGTVALCRSNLAGLLLELGQLTEAAAELEEAIRIGEKVGNRTFLPESYCFQARLRMLADDVSGAEESARHSISISESASSTIDVGIASRVLGAIYTLQGREDEALKAFSRAYECLEVNDPFEFAKTKAAESRCLRSRNAPGDAQRADDLTDAAKTTFEQLGARLELSLLKDNAVVR